MKLTIKPGLEIGDGCPTFIIAEIGSNWTNLDDCLLSIEKAANCGADAVKFQLFTYRTLYGLDEPINRYRTLSAFPPGYRDVEEKMRGQLPLDWLPKLKEKADQCEIEFMCSAFSPELIDAVDPYVNIHKLASAEMCHVRMLEKLRSITKPVFMSTGSHAQGEIEQSLEWISSDIRLDLVLMYCVAAYPARVVDLAHIYDLRYRFKTLVGFSDHTTDVLNIPQMASQTACVIEKHVSFIDAETADSPHSLTQYEFGRMVKRLRKNYVGEAMFGPTIAEQNMLTRHNRRLIAIQNIKAGERFVEGVNLGIFRSLKDAPYALLPFDIEKVQGKVAKNEIPMGKGIVWGDVE